MNCPACSRILYQRVISDTGGTCETAAVPDTGSPEYLVKVEDDFYRQARCGRRLRVCAQRFWLRRIDALCGPMSAPSTFSNMAALWNQPTAVARRVANHVCLCEADRCCRPVFPALSTWQRIGGLSWLSFAAAKCTLSTTGSAEGNGGTCV